MYIFIGLLFKVGCLTLSYLDYHNIFRCSCCHTFHSFIHSFTTNLPTGSVLMLFGPLLLFTPERKITVKNRILQAVVKASHKRETRYTSFVVFCIVTAAQGVVLYSLSLVLERIFRMSMVNMIGYCICYGMVSLLYLACFYSSMLRKPIVVGSFEPLAFLRSVPLSIITKHVKIVQQEEHHLA